MFISDTQLFTDSGWEQIQDVSGRDKILVKNFLGDAEFIQPFAIKKRQYSGEIVKIGAGKWSLSVTPDHSGLDEKKAVRRFKYMFPDEPKREYVTIYDEFGKRRVFISHQDWYVLVAYTLTRGFIRTSPGRPMLSFLLDLERYEHEILVLSDILDRIGLSYYVQYYKDARPRLIVSSKNTLVNRLVTRLGSTKRNEMFIPDKMIYSSTKELATLLIETIIELIKKPETKRGSKYQLSTTNKALIDSVTLLGTLSGYTMSTTVAKPAGTPFRGTVTTKDGYILNIYNQIKLYSRKYTKKLTYSGYVYGVNIFDGQVYVKQGVVPTWTSPN